MAKRPGLQAEEIAAASSESGSGGTETLAELLDERRLTIVEAHQECIRQGLKAGLTGRELEQLIADAMTKGEIPRVTFGMDLGNGLEFDLYHGTVPARVLNVHVFSNPDAPDFSAHVHLAQFPLNLTPEEGEDFRYRYQQVWFDGDSETLQAALTTLDQHMATSPEA